MSNVTIYHNLMYILYFASISVIMFVIIMILYYIYHIYHLYLLINTIETVNNTKIIYIRDTNPKNIDRILMAFLNNTVISINDNHNFRRILQKNSNKKLMIIIKSTGGYISSSDSMLNLLDCHKSNKTVYIPTYAMSAASLFTLACNNIHMNRYSVIGPTDPQISVFDEMISFRAVDKLIENKPIEHIKDKVLIQYYENKILYDDNIKLITKYVNKHKKRSATQNDINSLITKLSLGDIPHHTEINPDVLNKVLNINFSIPEDIIKIDNQVNYIFENA